MFALECKAPEKMHVAEWVTPTGLVPGTPLSYSVQAQNRASLSICQCLSNTQQTEEPALM